MGITDIISDEEIESGFVGTDFGSSNKRTLIARGVLKCASGFYSGSTLTAILKRFELVVETRRLTGQYQNELKLTRKGQEYLWAAFGDGQF